MLEYMYVPNATFLLQERAMGEKLARKALNRNICSNQIHHLMTSRDVIMHFKGTFFAFEGVQKKMLELNAAATLVNDASTFTSIFHQSINAYIRQVQAYSQYAIADLGQISMLSIETFHDKRRQTALLFFKIQTLYGLS